MSFIQGIDLLIFAVARLVPSSGVLCDGRCSAVSVGAPCNLCNFWESPSGYSLWCAADHYTAQPTQWLLTLATNTSRKHVVVCRGHVPQRENTDGARRLEHEILGGRTGELHVPDDTVFQFSYFLPRFSALLPPERRSRNQWGAGAREFLVSRSSASDEAWRCVRIT